VRASLIGIVAAALATSSASLAPPRARTFAGPTIMIFSGALLRERVVVAGVDETMPLMLGTRVDGAALERLKRALRARPSIDVWLFWGPQWRPLLGDAAAIARLTSTDATQRGRFHPARGRDDAILLLEPTSGAASSATRMTSDALSRLDRRGIPVRTP
jgi:hypothetical protein